jgi:hypothetical protein
MEDVGKPASRAENARRAAAPMSSLESSRTKWNLDSSLAELALLREVGPPSSPVREDAP